MSDADDPNDPSSSPPGEAASQRSQGRTSSPHAKKLDPGTQGAAEAPGLPMVKPPDPEALAAESAWLRDMETKPALTRGFAFLKRGGPGYLQAAMTLGGGSASYCLFAGAAFGYQLLWVAPVAMLLGVIVMSAVAHQTLSTGMRPLEAMRRHAGPFFAYGWAFGALLASVIWHLPQYALVSSVMVDMGSFAGVELSPLPMALIIMAVAIGVVLMYGRSLKWVAIFERTMRFMIYAVILCFAAVVIRTGIAHPGDLFSGFFAFRIPEAVNGVSGLTTVVSGLSAAVGINMLFLYPYTLLSRGWGRDHRRIARFDLGAGMFVPYLIATSLMVIATANTFHYGELPFTGERLQPVEAAQALTGVVGASVARVVFNLGILGMATSTIVLHMLCAGFVCSEVFGWKVGSKKYHLACMIPAPGVIGAVVWKKVAFHLALTTNVVCGLLMPVAYIGFILLQRNRRYLGDDAPKGALGLSWLIGMVIATLVLIAFLASYIWQNLG